VNVIHRHARGRAENEEAKGEQRAYPDARCPKMDDIGTKMDPSPQAFIGSAMTRPGQGRQSDSGGR
jgi:hypothetical protein